MTGSYIVFEERCKAVLNKFDIPSLETDEVLLENDFTVISAGTERANLMALPNTEHDDYKTFLKLVAAKKLHARSLISEIDSPEAATEVYARLAENNNPPLGIVFDWNRIR